MTLQEVARRIAGVPPLHIEELELLLWLHENEPTLTEITEAQSSLERVANKLDKLAKENDEVVKRLTCLTPIPSSKIPIGF
jgi:N-glycosylase/DNA lyase